MPGSRRRHGFCRRRAAFGQKLRGDTWLGEYDYAAIADLAGAQRNYWRQEFVELVRLAGKSDMRMALGQEG